MKARRGKRIDKALREAMLTLLDATAEQLALARDPDAVVHGTRKAIKRLRAVARLVRHDVGGSACRDAERRWRKIARALGPLRESRVRVDTLEQVAAAAPELIPPERLAALSGRLRETHERSMATLSREHFFGGLARELAATRPLVMAWSLSRDPRTLLEPGLRRSYRHTRRTFRALPEHPADEALHDWRKRVKVLWGQLRLLARIRSSALDALLADLDELGERLGADHDCADFEAQFLAADRLGLGSAGTDALRSALGERRSRLQREARALGGRLFEQRPREFSEEIVRWVEDRWD